MLRIKTPSYQMSDGSNYFDWKIEIPKSIIEDMLSGLSKGALVEMVLNQKASDDFYLKDLATEFNTAMDSTVELTLLCSDKTKFDSYDRFFDWMRMRLKQADRRLKVKELDK